MELLIYLLKVSACTVLFFAFYLLVLRHLTFFKINRFYLLITLLLSFIIPTLNFTIEREVEATPTVYTPIEVVDEVIAKEPVTAISPIETAAIIEESFDYYSLLPYLYFAIVSSLLIIATWRILKLFKYTKRIKHELNGLKIVQKSAGFTNCSFFNYVFIADNLSEAELQILLKHEEVHAKQLHSIDKLVLMLIKAFLWFNPVVYLYDKALEQAHEYEADEATSQNVGTEQYANLLLRLAITKSEMPLVHNFVKSPIKDRIKMLFNSKSKNMKKLMYLLALPIGLGLLWGFTVKVVEVAKDTKVDEKTFTLVLDAGHGGKEKGAVVNGISEKDITLAMAKKIKKLAEAKGIKVVTTREVDENVSIKDRVKANGDILISLHVNSEPTANGGKRNGIEMYTAVMDGTLKVQKANSFSRSLFKGMQHIQGINIKDQRQAKSLALLRETKVPGIILELGYLTNKNDLKFITDEAKQNELATGIVDGILLYKEKIPSDYKAENYAGNYMDVLKTKKFPVRELILSPNNQGKERKLIGKNPTVLIDGKNYPSNILARISRQCVKISVLTKNKIEITTKNNKIMYATPIEIYNENIRKQIQESNQAIARFIQKYDNGTTYDVVNIKFVNGGMSKKIPKNSKLLYVTQGRNYSEEDIKTKDFENGKKFKSALVLDKTSLAKYYPEYVGKYDAVVQIFSIPNILKN